jgi:hypothetical protein
MAMNFVTFNQDYSCLAVGNATCAATTATADLRARDL